MDSGEGKKIFSQLAQECLDKQQPGEYNQSIMDFGATVCKPAPVCKICVLSKTCIAFNKNKIELLPVKLTKPVKKERWFSYFIFSFNDRKFVQQRIAKDIWQNLHEFYLEETTANPEWNIKEIKEWLIQKLNISNIKNINIIPAKKQLLTHQIIQGYFIRVDLNENPASVNLQTGLWLNDAEIKAKAFPRFINQFTSRKTFQRQIL